jgi:hypothetical protein
MHVEEKENIIQFREQILNSQLSIINTFPHRGKYIVESMSPSGVSSENVCTANESSNTKCTSF